MAALQQLSKEMGRKRDRAQSGLSALWSLSQACETLLSVSVERQFCLARVRVVAHLARRGESSSTGWTVKQCVLRNNVPRFWGGSEERR